MEKKIPIIIDCDPGHDDAIALIMAFAARNLEVLGVTTTRGNQTLEKTTRNALKVLDYIGKTPVVAAGCHEPLVRPLQVAPSVHGESGLDGPSMPEPSLKASATVCMDLNRTGFVQLLHQCCASYAEGTQV